MNFSKSILSALIAAFSFLPLLFYGQVELKTDILFPLTREIGFALEVPISDRSSLNLAGNLYNAPSTRSRCTDCVIDWRKWFSQIYFGHDARFLNFEYRYYISETEPKRMDHFFGTYLTYRYTQNGSFDELIENEGTSAYRVIDVNQTSHATALGITHGFKATPDDNLTIELHTQIGRYRMNSIVYSNGYDIEEAKPNQKGYWADKLPRWDIRLSFHIGVQF